MNNNSDLTLPPPAALIGPDGRTLHSQPSMPAKPTRQQLRQAERQREKLRKPGGQLSSDCRHGDLRILPCSNPAHPLHVHIFSEQHGEWLPCDDTSPVPAAILAAMTADPGRVAFDRDEQGDTEQFGDDEDSDHGETANHHGDSWFTGEEE